MSQIPTVGRIVHYQSHGSPNGQHPSVARAAVIAEVHGHGEVTLCVLNPSGIFFGRASYDEANEPGTWCWPPRA